MIDDRDVEVELYSPRELGLPDFFEDTPVNREHIKALRRQREHEAYVRDVPYVPTTEFRICSTGEVIGYI